MKTRLRVLFYGNRPTWREFVGFRDVFGKMYDTDVLWNLGQRAANFAGENYLGGHVGSLDLLNKNAQTSNDPFDTNLAQGIGVIKHIEDSNGCLLVAPVKNEFARPQR